MKRCDVMVIGAGTAGQTAAYRLAENGLSVVVADNSEHPGGVCALYGCQPKKWFYEAAETMAKCRHLSGKGVDGLPVMDWSAIRAQKNAFTTSVSEGTPKGLADAGIDMIHGTARFIDGHTIAVGDHTCRAAHTIIATGSAPMPLGIAGEDHLIDNRGFLELETVPGRLVFIGGGFVSFEFAHFAARLGADDTAIHILEVGDRPLGPFDADLVEALVAASVEDGIEVHTGIRVSSVTQSSSGFRVETDQGQIFEADRVVHGAGRAPRLEGLELAAAGVETGRRGIRVDRHMQTSNPDIYAVGDCAETIQLARVADYEGHVAAARILAAAGKAAQPEAIDYSAVPAILFTYPQFGMVGQTEAGLKAAGIQYRKSQGERVGWPTYRRVGMAHAAYKLLADADGRILGGHFLSDQAAGLVNAVRLAMINDIPVQTLYWQHVMSPYPTRESDLLYMLAPLLE